MSDPSYRGTCFCGAVEIRVTGTPKAMGYCHCASCRAWSAAPVNAFSLWSPESVSVTKGAEHVGEFHKTPQSHRQFCRVCGGHILAQHPPWNLVDVYSAVIPDFEHRPALHVNYQEKVLSVRDGLPKFKDLPKDFGGSGEMLPE
ncbi:GFA family protein [Pendulispora brunnea]|uniref:GFA family protein n=1 Tax=Pendulispora brunnea TaxID=2905690 RepID=A0ABZ2JYT3_9BACT